MTKRRKIAIFMMGLPAAGKSSYVREHFPNWSVVDADKIKKTHPDYDSKNSDAVHDWSLRKYDVVFAQTLLDDNDFVCDGTGTRFEPLIQKIRKAKMRGYTTKLIYVVVPLKLSLSRNAARERQVPEWAIIEKAEAIEIAFELVAREVDEVAIFDNSKESESMK